MNRSEINWPVISRVFLEELDECPICKRTNTCRISRARLVVICEHSPMGCIDYMREGSKTFYMHVEDLFFILFKLKADGESL